MRGVRPFGAEEAGDTWAILLFLVHLTAYRVKKETSWCRQGGQRNNNMAVCVRAWYIPIEVKSAKGSIFNGFCGYSKASTSSRVVLRCVFGGIAYWPANPAILGNNSSLIERGKQSKIQKSRSLLP